MAMIADFTFICLGDNEVATHVDVQAMSAEGIRAHAIGLLREHASAARVEIWQSETLALVLPRDGVRVWPGARPATGDDLLS